MMICPPLWASSPTPANSSGRTEMSASSTPWTTHDPSLCSSPCSSGRSRPLQVHGHQRGLSNLLHRGLVGTRKVNFAMGKDGVPVNFVEKFIVGKVKRPILCAGRLLRSGWEMRRSEDGLNLWHKQGVEIPLEMRKNSLQVVAEICWPRTTSMRRNGTRWRFARSRASCTRASRSWRRPPAGTCCQTAWRPTVIRWLHSCWTRMTFMKTKDGKWMQVENVSDYTELGNMAFWRFGPTEDPQRSCGEDGRTQKSRVAPFPTTFRELQSDELGWSRNCEKGVRGAACLPQGANPSCS